MVNYPHEHFLSITLDLPHSVLKETLIMLIHGYLACGKLPARSLNFSCSTTDIRRFLERSALSYRRARQFHVHPALSLRDFQRKGDRELYRIPLAACHERDQAAIDLDSEGQNGAMP
jgi:hypothetical protein